MADFPFLLLLEASLAGNLTGTLQYTVPVGETLEIYGFWQNSTGTFNITDIRDTKGAHYTNASGAQEIPGEFLPDVGNQFNSITSFPIPIVIPGGVTLLIDLEDSSGAANVVTLVGRCVKRVGV